MCLEQDSGDKGPGSKVSTEESGNKALVAGNCGSNGQGGDSRNLNVIYRVQ